MAIEKRRGCGYRKVGGTYLVSEGHSVPCDRLPIKLDVCPVCSHGFKQSRGWTWVNLFGLVGGNHTLGPVAGEADAPCPCFKYCPLCHNVKAIGKAGLLWIGEKFYKTPDEFMREGRDMGFSRRVHAIPRGFKVGETWVLLAHPKTVPGTEIDQEILASYGSNVAEGSMTEEEAVRLATKDVLLPGIFTLWMPTRIEKIVLESQRDSEEVKELIEKGITPVFVPDDDKDHQGSVFDKEEEEAELPLTAN